MERPGGRLPFGAPPRAPGPPLLSRRQLSVPLAPPSSPDALLHRSHIPGLRPPGLLADYLAHPLPLRSISALSPAPANTRAEYELGGGKVPRRMDMRGQAEFETTCKALFNKEQFSDVTFVFPSSGSSSAPQAKLYAYKGIMCVWSDYFHNMFQGGFKEESQREVMLKDVDFEAFTKVVLFMYTGLVDLTEDGVWAVLSLADMYHVALLKAACLTFVESILGDDNAIQVLSFAEQHSFNHLFEEAVTYIAQRFDTVSSSKEFAGVSKEALSAILSNSLLRVSDPWIVVSALWEWTEDQADVPHVTLEAPPKSKPEPRRAEYLIDESDLGPHAPLEPKGKEVDRGDDHGRSKKADATLEEERGAGEQDEEDAQTSTIEAKRKYQRDLLEEMLPLLRLWAMPCETLQHIEKLPALAGVPELKEQLLIAWKCKAGYAPPTIPSFGDPAGHASRNAKRMRTAENDTRADQRSLSRHLLARRRPARPPAASPPFGHQSDWVDEFDPWS